MTDQPVQDTKPQARLSAQRQALLQRWARGREAADAMSAAPPGAGPRPLSYAQQRMWFLHQVDPAGAIYNVPAAVRLVGTLDLDALQRTLAEIVRRHEVLRTRFDVRDGSPVQEVMADFVLDVQVRDLSHMDEGARAAEVETLALAHAQAPFNLTRDAPVRALVLRLAPELHVLLFALHHIACDGWSLGVLVREVGALYEAYAQGLPSPLPPLMLQYGDFAVWQRRWLDGGVSARQLAYWRGQLHDAPATLDLPTDRPRTATRDYTGARCTFALTATDTQALQALALRSQASLFALTLAGFQLLLARWSGQTDFCVGTPTANRGRPEVEPLIGFFVNTLVLRARLQPGMSFLQLLQRTRDTAVAGLEHQDIPFEYLVEALRPARELNQSPLFQVMFAMQTTWAPQAAARGLSLEPVEVAAYSARFDLAVDVYLAGDRLEGFIDYPVSLFDAGTIARLRDGFLRVLAHVARQPETPVGDIPLADAAQAALLSAAPPAALPGGVDAFALFAAQAARQPAHAALVLGDEVWTYGQLAGGAAAVAHALRQRGAGPESVVAVAMERAPWMIVSLLAVWQVGAAYLPLDPAHPAQRVREMLAEAAPCCVLRRGAAQAPLELDVEAAVAAGLPAREAGAAGPRQPLPPGGLAYIIYTSGSSGRPKGVQVPVGAFAHHVLASIERYGIVAADRVLQYSSTSFDASLEQICCALCAGATLVLRGPELWSPERLVDEIVRHRINIANVPAALWSAMPAVLRQAQAQSPLRLMIVGGEALVTATAAELAFDGVVLNAYGPTETTVTATTHAIRAGGGMPAGAGSYVPIGRPVAGARMYVLDERLQPLPQGWRGELYIAGPGVARGYLGRPDLTAERFVPDPFGVVPGARMYRTGDLVRVLPGGDIDYLERADRQLKLRGFRIEPGEIEAVLASHPRVGAALVTAHEDASLGRRLLAYVVAQGAGDDASQVRGWQATFDEVNAAPEASAAANPASDQAFDHDFDISGWTSSFDRLPIPAAEMADWVASTVARVRALQPRRLLEIGCGTGLLLFRLAPDCQDYVGVDFSAQVLERLRGHLNAVGVRCPVRLLQREAADVADLADASVDTVLINSVVQYFPSEGYLERVLSTLLERLPDGARIFVGDVRNLALHETLRTAVALHEADAAAKVGEVRDAVRKALANETELLIDPAWFRRLRERQPRIAGLQVLPKALTVANELTRYRYDVVLAVGTAPAAAPAPAWQDWTEATRDGGDALEAAIRSGDAARCALADVPHPLLQADLARAAALQAAPAAARIDAVTAGTTAGTTPTADTADRVEHVLASAHAAGYQVHTGYADAACTRLNVLLSRAARPFDAAVFDVDDASPPGRALANRPAGAQSERSLPAQLLAHVASRLPDYMVPAQVVVLQRFPLTPTGKVDRAALPAPSGLRGDEGYVPPQGATEQALAGLWGELLGLDRVGRHDDFFMLGGHSLLSIRLLHAVRERLGVALPLATMFGASTLSALAALVDAGAPASALVVSLREATLAAAAGGPVVAMLHPIGGELSCYHALVQAWPGGDRLLGVQSPEAAGRASPFRDGNAMALAYAAALREQGGGGPYRLVGWSSGGALALAVAQALLNSGAEVTEVVLVDAGPPDQAGLAADALGVAAGAIAAAARGAALDADGLAEARRRAGALGRDLAALLQDGDRDALRQVLEPALGRVAEDAEIDHLRALTVRARHHLALLCDLPGPELAIPVRLLRTRATGRLDTAGRDRWRGLRSLEETLVDGTHYDVLAPPRVAMLAQALAAAPA